MRNTIDITLDRLDYEFVEELVRVTQWAASREAGRDEIEVTLGTLRVVKDRPVLVDSSIRAADYGVCVILDETLPRAARRGVVTELSVMLGAIPGGLWDELVGFAVRHKASGERRSDDLVELDGGTLHVVGEHTFHEHVRVVARREAVEELAVLLARANSWQVPPDS